MSFAETIDGKMFTLKTLYTHPDTHTDIIFKGVFIEIAKGILI